MIDVLIVDDQITVKEILKSYIEPDPGLNLIGWCDSFSLNPVMGGQLASIE